MSVRAGGRVRCLSIGSSDSSGGAGIQGDVKAFAALGAYGMTVVVGITSQSTTGVAARHGVAMSSIASQLDSVIDDIGVDAVKVGTTWSSGVMRVIASRLAALTVPIVVDPVMVTAAGSALGSGAGTVSAVQRWLLPLATVVTPNLAEAQRLAGLPGERSPARLAEAIAAAGARAVVITDAFGDTGGDWLFDGRAHHAIEGRRHATGCDHGAGCAHSSALAVLLARGHGLLTAVRRAHEIVAASVLAGAADIGAGRHPVDVLAGVRALDAPGGPPHSDEARSCRRAAASGSAENDCSSS